eukprot:scaffold72069_cov72-Attheya_sp.AAC.1
MHCSLLGDDNADGDTLGAILGNLDGTVLGKDDEGSALGEDDCIELGFVLGDLEGSKSQSPTMIEPSCMFTAATCARPRPHNFAFFPSVSAPISKVVPCKMPPAPTLTAPSITQNIFLYVAPSRSTM